MLGLFLCVVGGFFLTLAVRSWGSLRRLRREGAEALGEVTGEGMTVSDRITFVAGNGKTVVDSGARSGKGMPLRHAVVSWTDLDGTEHRAASRCGRIWAKYSEGAQVTVYRHPRDSSRVVLAGECPAPKYAIAVLAGMWMVLAVLPLAWLVLA
ncbi:hypothetical protein EMG21_29355 [Klebsiella pneumoniae]|nr:hypothetical protein EMG21_29355 [Klebsiella pneumoniae]